MENKLAIFNYDGSEIRTVQKDNETWWVLKDVCDVLDLSNPTRVAERLDEDELSSAQVTDSLGREQQTNIINESGLYTVILRSDKPKAKDFKRWVTHEVLPTIRKTGTYHVKGYERKATSIGEVASLIKVLRSVMKEQQSPAEKIAEMAEGLCKQFNITLPDNFVMNNPYQINIFLLPESFE